jgi:hypothetical protein
MRREEPERLSDFAAALVVMFFLLAAGWLWLSIGLASQAAP